LKSQVATLDSELAALKNEADRAMAELAVATESESESRRKATLMEKNIDGLNKEIDRLKSEHSSVLANLNDTLSSIEAERDDALARSASTQEQAEAFAEEKSEMMSVISDLQNSFANARSDVESLTNRISVLETEIEALNSERDSAVEQASALSGRLGNSERQLIELSGLADGYKLQLDEAAERRRAEIESINAVRETVNSRLNETDVEGVEVTTRDNNTAVGITIGSGNLFRAGSAELSQEGRQVLASVAQAIAGYEDWNIDVDGHTDNQPIGGALLARYPSNWELSVARASSAVRFLQEEAGIDPAQLSARGFAETRPLDPADTPEARRTNRRVEVVLRKP